MLRVRIRKSLLLDKLESGFVVFVLFLATAPLVTLLRLESRNTASFVRGDPIIQSLWGGVYIIAFLFIAIRLRRFIYVATRDKILLLLVGIALTSTLWSTAPWVTLRRGVALVVTTALGAYLATRYNLKEQLRLLAWALGIAALFSVLFALVLPDYGIHQIGSNSGAWRGIYHQKMVLGKYMALGALAFLLIAQGSDRYRLIAWGSFSLLASLFMLSRSRTALVAFVTVLICLPLFRVLRQRWHYGLVVPFLVILVLLGSGVATFIYSQAETFLGLLGKDTTLTGRTQLWSGVFEMILQRPLLGYGYGGFWLGWEGPSAELWRALPWLPNHAHNGLLELWLTVGLIGLSVFVLHFLIVFLRALRELRLNKTAEGLWPVVFLALFFLVNLTESLILVRNNLFWILYVATSLTMLVQREQVGKTSRVNLTREREMVGNAPRTRDSYLPGPPPSAV
jgi:exopolysaccharide production protein ExoQ